MNPYDPPAPTPPAIYPSTERFYFDGQVTETDIERALWQRSILLRSLFALLVGCSGLVAVGVLLNWEFSRPANRQAFSTNLSLILICIASLVLVSSCFLGLTRGKRIARRLPFMLGPCRGWISIENFHAERPHSVVDWNLKALYSANINGQCLVLNFHPHQLLMSVIPLNAFEHAQSVHALVTTIQQNLEARTPQMIDPKLSQEVEMPDGELIPGDGIPFRGWVMTEDIARTPLSRPLRTSTLITLGLGVGLPALAIGFGWQYLSWLTLLSLLVTLRLWKAYRRSVLPLQRPGTSIWFAVGNLNADRLRTISFRQQGSFEWAFFQSATISEGVIALEYHGSAKVFGLLARRQFASDADWKKAISIISERVPVKGNRKRL